MRKSKSILWGIVLVVFGIAFALNALEITNLNLLFDGWWTLFIIVPCSIGLFTESDKIGNIIGIAVGVLLLLSCQKILSFDLVWKLAIPIAIIFIGLKLIFKDGLRNKSDKIIMKLKENGSSLKQYCATFSGQNLDFDGENFDGADLTAVFGGIDLKLNNAIIDKDVVINICSVFGGVDVFLPDNVNVKVSSNSIFGGVSNKKNKSENAQFTVYINANCIFGGADIK